MRQKSWGQERKSILDIIFQKYRFLRVKEGIKPNSAVLDLGCGYYAEFLNYISNQIRLGVGVDLVVDKKHKGKNISLVEGRVDKKINLKNNSFDVVTSLALIEHVENPQKMLLEAHRMLKKDGVLLLTTPDVKSKPLLEFMSFKLGVISKTEIRDHKRYYTKKTLFEILARAGFSKNMIEVETFGFTLNLFARAKK